MKKGIIVIILILVIGSIYTLQELKEDPIENTRNRSADNQLSHQNQRIARYLGEKFANGYLCDELSGHKYFFDFSSTPYNTGGDMLIAFTLRGYTKTSLGNITDCGGGGGNVIIHDDGKDISLMHSFSDLPSAEIIPDKFIALQKELKNTTYEQAKTYFNIVNNNTLYTQDCFAALCDKVWYSIIETGDNLNDTIIVYSTRKPQEAISNGGRWSLLFSGNHTVIESSHSCLNNGWCVSTGTRENINYNTVQYPMVGDPSRYNRFEIIDISDEQLKIRFLYE